MLSKYDWILSKQYDILWRHGTINLLHLKGKLKKKKFSLRQYYILNHQSVLCFRNAKDQNNWKSTDILEKGIFLKKPKKKKKMKKIQLKH